MKVVTFYQLAKSAACAILAMGMVGSTAGQANADITEFTGATTTFFGLGDINNTAVLTSFSTSFGTVSSLTSAVKAFGSFDSGNGIRNLWGQARTPTGADLELTAMLDLDISTGVLNVGDSNDGSSLWVTFDGVVGASSTKPAAAPRAASFLFSETGTFETTAAGTGNDFFLVDIDGPTGSGGDVVTLRPIGLDGVEIGDFVLEIDAADWGLGWTGVGLDLLHSTNSVLNDYRSTGLAFDLTDFSGTGTLTGMAGISIIGLTGLDVMAIGRNSDLVETAAVPEPTSLALIGLAGLGMVSRRRRLS